MESAKQARLESNGWKIGTVSDFLGLTPEAEAAIEIMSTIAIEPNVFYTLDEVARLLRVSRAAALRLIKSGKAPAVQIGRQWRVLGAALLNLGDPQSESESEHVRDWWTASNSALREVWDNEEDAVYDQL